MDRDKMFAFRCLTAGDLDDVLSLQDECVSQLADPGLYYPLTADEFSESLSMDIVVGAYDCDKLVAVAVIVVNRDGARNLAVEAGCRPDSTFTFDAVMVLPRSRGYGLQNILLRQCIELARKNNISHIVATVSPDNSYSLDNFTRLGFEIVATSRKYAGLVRHIIKYDVAR